MEWIFEMMKCVMVVMVEKVVYCGGYVWSYLLDFLCCWGELEVCGIMIWI